VCVKWLKRFIGWYARAEAGEQQQAQLAEQQKGLYQQLITTTEQMVRQAQQVTTCLLHHTQKQAERLVAHVEPLLPLGQRVIFQARSRVLQGKQVAESRQSAQSL